MLHQVAHEGGGGGGGEAVRGAALEAPFPVVEPSLSGVVHANGCATTTGTSTSCSRAAAIGTSEGRGATRRRGAGEGLWSSSLVPLRHNMASLTVFQKGCAAAATVGSACASAFGYATHRHIEDAAFREWLRQTSPMAADQVDQFLIENMPQTVKAIRIEEELGAPVAVGRSPADSLGSAVHASRNLGGAPALPSVSNSSRLIFGRLEEPKSAAESASAEQGPMPNPALPTSAAPTPSPTAIGVSLPQRPMAMEMVVDAAGPIAPDEEEETAGEGVAEAAAPYPDGLRWGGAAAGGPPTALLPSHCTWTRPAGSSFAASRPLAAARRALVSRYCPMGLGLAAARAWRASGSPLCVRA